MPSHVFLPLGMWDEAVASDESAFAASVAIAKRKGLSASQYDFHALSWLHYEYLQQGRFSKAREAMAEVQRAMAEPGRAGRAGGPGRAGEAGGAGEAGEEGRAIDARVRVWFNPRLESRDFMLPGILALLLLAITTNLASMGIVRERELGTLEQLNVTPLRR